jgi:hypothetical protein
VHLPQFTVIWPVGMFIVSTVAGISLCFRYGASLALEQKQFEEEHGISRNISLRFRIFRARFLGAIALAMSLATGVWCMVAAFRWVSR